jgi:uncharacterized protein YegP (UPF0339 family)
MTTLTRTLSILTILAATAFAAPGCAMDDTGAGSDNVAAVTGRPYFEVFKSESNSRWYFHLSAANHEIILQSQGYSSRTASLGGMLSVLNNGGIDKRYDLRVASNGQHYFVLKARNGATIGMSEMYETKQGAENGIDSVINAVDDYIAFQNSRTGARFDVSEGTDGRFYFSLKAKNGESVLQSQGYSSEASALNGCLSVADNGVDPANYDLEKASNGGYYFNVIASNGQVIATSEVYHDKYNAERAIDSIVNLLPYVEVL